MDITGMLYFWRYFVILSLMTLKLGNSEQNGEKKEKQKCFKGFKTWARRSGPSARRGWRAIPAQSPFCSARCRAAMQVQRPRAGGPSAPGGPSVGSGTREQLFPPHAPPSQPHPLSRLLLCRSCQTHKSSALHSSTHPPIQIERPRNCLARIDFAS